MLWLSRGVNHGLTLGNSFPIKRGQKEIDERSEKMYKVEFGAGERGQHELKLKL